MRPRATTAERRRSAFAGASAALLAVSLLMIAPASGITVEKVISNAKGFANHKWTATAANAKASCYAAYVSPFLTKYGLGTHVGLPYDYANWVTLAQFDGQIAKGYGAGSQTSFGLLSCTTGHDCSGFVSRVWEHPKRYTTHYMHQISKEIPATSIAKGDIYNYPGKHVVLWDGVASNGAPRFYEAAGGVWKVWYATTKSWSYLSGYVARRYDNIQGGTGGGGTTPTPVIIPVKSFPFSHSANTVTTGAAIWSDYGAACPPPSGGELGPEIVYALDIPSAGMLKVELSDGLGVDLDVHLLTSLDPKSCVARHDTTIGPLAVQPGKRYVVADTWSNSAGVPKPGPYSISITFTSSCVAKSEVCNGEDDDCDGAVDEGALCDDGLPCTDDVCGPAGVCEVEPNGKSCFIGGTCVAAGAAQPGAACAACDPSAPTVWSQVDGIACADDGNPCTSDACQGGACAHPPADAKACADDGNPCTSDTCMGGACAHPPANGAACADDGNPCTSDACQGGACAHPPIDGGACDDGAPCTVTSSCKGGGCVAGAPVLCGPPSGPCVAAACDAATGLCGEQPLPAGTPCGEASCSGGVASTPATCDGQGGCAPGASYGCGSYACSPAGLCRTSCGGDADCAAKASCVAGLCVAEAGGGGGDVDADGDVGYEGDVPEASDGGSDDDAGGDDDADEAALSDASSQTQDAGWAARDATTDAAVTPWLPPAAPSPGCSAATSSPGRATSGATWALGLALALLLARRRRPGLDVA